MHYETKMANKDRGLTGKEVTSLIQVSSKNQMKNHPQLLVSKRGKEEGYIGI